MAEYRRRELQWARISNKNLVNTDANALNGKRRKDGEKSVKTCVNVSAFLFWFLSDCEADAKACGAMKNRVQNKMERNARALIRLRALSLSLSLPISLPLSLLLSLSLANWRAFVSVSDSLCVSFVSERLLRTDVFKNALACHAPFERLLVKKYATAY